MNELEKNIVAAIMEIVPKAEKIDFRASVDDSAYSIEFFETENGKKNQCFDLVDAGIISEENIEKCFKKVAALIRKSKDYRSGQLNKINFSTK